MPSTIKDHLMSPIHVFIKICLVACLLATSIRAQSSDSLSDLSLADLMNIEIQLASGSKATTVKKAPGIVTVITREDIVTSGARDLMDVLMEVPGFYFGTDIMGVVGVGVRGQWAHEGKLLLMIDGMPMNEHAFSNLEFGYHYPLENVAQIEIIRGPGSALYGGYAELSVINIITRATPQFSGLSAGATYGSMVDAAGHQGVNLSTAFTAGEAHLQAMGRYGQETKSNKTYTDIFGDSMAMKNDAASASYFGQLSLQWRDLECRVLYDRYDLTQRDEYDHILGAPVHNVFDILNTQVHYAIRPAEGIVLTPSLFYSFQSPWNAPYSAAAQNYPYHAQISTLTGGLDASADVGPAINLTGGVSGTYNHIRKPVSVEYGLDAYDAAEFALYNGTDTMSSWNLALYAQCLAALEVVDVTAGLRYEYNNLYGSSVAPRIAVTRALDKLHFKALLSGAFRSPGLENINQNYIMIGEGYPADSIKPEQTWTAEIEAGFSPAQEVNFTVNSYFLRINSPIVYNYYLDTAENSFEGYENHNPMSTWGIETSALIRYPLFSLKASYSYYRAIEIGAEPYRVSGHNEVTLGAPAHKVSLTPVITVLPALSIAPTLIWNSSVYAYTYTDTMQIDSANYEAQISELPQVFLVNVHLQYALPMPAGLTLGAGIRNLLDDRALLAQAFNGGHAPLPGRGREFYANVQYDFKW